jgi:hypothetical protein
MDEVDLYRFPWSVMLWVVSGTLLLGILIEIKRPYKAAPGDLPAMGHASAAFREHIKTRVNGGETIVFWDIQNPKYAAWLAIAIPLALWVSAGIVVRESVWAAVLNAAVGLLLLLFYGGQRTRVNRDGVTIRYGLLGIRIFRCRLDEVAGICVRSFAPLADFGGYGIRTAKGITAYYLAGCCGVQLELVNRRSVLIGSSNPERLASVIEALGETTADVESEVTS